MRKYLLALLAASTSCSTPEQKPLKPLRPAGIYMAEFKGIHYRLNGGEPRYIGYTEFLDDDTLHRKAANMLISEELYTKFDLRYDKGQLYAPNRVVVLEVGERSVDGKQVPDTILHAKDINPEMKDFWRKRIIEEKEFDKLFPKDTAIAR